MPTRPAPFVLPPQGRPGIAGVPGDYGYIRYGELAGAPVTTMDPYVEAPFVVTQPRTMTNTLRPPFKDFAFFDDGNILRCRKPGDSYLLSVRVSVVPQYIGGWFEFNLYIANNISGLSGATSSRRFQLSDQAGAVNRVDELLQVFPSSGFAVNGAVLMMRASVPVALTNEVLFITPVSAAQ